MAERWTAGGDCDRRGRRGDPGDPSSPGAHGTGAAGGSGHRALLLAAGLADSGPARAEQSPKRTDLRGPGGQDGEGSRAKQVPADPRFRLVAGRTVGRLRHRVQPVHFGHQTLGPHDRRDARGDAADPARHGARL